MKYLLFFLKKFFTPVVVKFVVTFSFFEQKAHRTAPTVATKLKALAHIMSSNGFFQTFFIFYTGKTPQACVCLPYVVSFTSYTLP